MASGSNPLDGYLSTTEVILTVEELCDVRSGLQLLLGMADEVDLYENRETYAPKTEGRQRAYALLCRLMAAKDLRSQLEC